MADTDDWVMSAALNLLNELVARDRDAIEKLIEKRVPTNGELDEHPDAVLNSSGHLGALGLFNSLVSRMTGGRRVMAVYDGPDGKERLARFAEWPPGSVS